MVRSAGQWSVQLVGSASGDTGADVLLAIDRLYHGLPRELPMHDLLLTELDDLNPSDFGAAMKFTLTFVASPGGKAP
jgi:hypothetical protein